MNIQRSAHGGNIPAGVAEAMRLGELGWSVFPLNPGTGKPYANATIAAALGVPEPGKGGGGLHFASTDTAAIQAMWTACPDAQIGIATGQRSGMYVLDVDRKAGRDGFASLNAAGHAIPATFWTDTRSGGRHYYFAIPRDGSRRYVSDAGMIASGADRRGDGGYVRWYGAAFACSGSVPMPPPPDWMMTAAMGGDGARKPLGTMQAPSFDAALKALRSIDPNELDRDSWRNVSMAFRQCATGLTSDFMLHEWWQAFCAQYEGNSKSENDTLWRSCDGGTSVGWSCLLRHAAPHVQAQLLGVPAVGFVQSGTLPTPPPIDCASEILTPAEQRLWFAGCVLIGPENRIMDGKGQVFDPGAFNATFGGKKFIIDADGKITDEPWKAATRGTQFAIAKVDGTTFRTDVPTGHISTDELGRTYANTYIAARIERMQGDAGPFLS